MTRNLLIALLCATVLASRAFAEPVHDAAIGPGSDGHSTLYLVLGLAVLAAAAIVYVGAAATCYKRDTRPKHEPSDDSGSTVRPKR